MSTQSLIIILLIGFTPNAFSSSMDIYSSIKDVKIKLQGTSSFETRKKDFMKFSDSICRQRQTLRAKVQEAHRQFEHAQITSETLNEIDMERYNYYDLCDFLKEIPTDRSVALKEKNCSHFINNLKRSSKDDSFPGDADEDPIQDLNLQALQIGKLLYDCHQ